MKSRALSLALFTILLSTFFVSLLLAQEEAASGSALYTAYNIWFEKPEKMYSINYKKGNLIPAGTAVDNITLEEARNPYIEFRVVEWDQTFKIFFEAKYFTDINAEQFRDRVFTSKTLSELTQGMNETETEAIKNAKIVPGISKAAVLIAYGYPPSHMTTNLEMNTWTYWRNRFMKDLVEFDADGKTLTNLDWR
jgi:hypothetical protein